MISKSAKVKRIKNDPPQEEVKDKPKRKPTGYMLWAQEERLTISKYEAFSGQDIMRILGSRWKKLSEEVKLEWKNKSKDEPKPEEKAKKPKREPKKDKTKDDDVKNKKSKKAK